MAKQQNKTGFSFRREDATDGGGIEGALATIDEIGFVEGFTYGGRHKDKPVIALRTVYRVEGLEKPWEDHWPVGDESKYELVNDGDSVRSVGKGTGLNRKSGAYFFFDHLQTAIEEGDLDYDDVLPEIDGEGCRSIRELEGKQVRLTVKPFTGVSGDTKDKAVIASFVSEDEAPRTNGKAGQGNVKVTKGGSSPKGSSAEDIAEKAETIVVALIEAKTSVKKGDVANLIHQEAKKDPDVKAMMQYGFRENWLADEARPWAYNKKRGVLTAKEE
jgi:hypothetical protein